MLEEISKKALRLLIIAKCLTLLFCTWLTLEVAADSYIYLLIVVAYIALLLIPQKSRVYYEYISFITAVLFIVYIYLHTPDTMAVILFYLYAVYMGLHLRRNYSLVSAIVIAGTYMSVNLTVLEYTSYHLISTLMHTVLIININMLAQHMACLERNAQQQSGKMEKLLGQMERSYREVIALAERDGLTGLYNYRTFQSTMESISLENISLLLIDIDYFKSFNDIYGHLCGDDVLRSIADVLTASFRDSDMIFRYGGEEFAVIIMSNLKCEVQAAAKRVAQNVAAKDFSNQMENALRVTVSIGYAVGNSNIKEAEELFRLADEALYLAKNNGRNLIGCPDGTLLEA